MKYWLYRTTREKRVKLQRKLQRQIRHNTTHSVWFIGQIPRQEWRVGKKQQQQKTKKKKNKQMRMTSSITTLKQVSQVFLKVAAVLHRGQQSRAAMTDRAITLCDSLLHCRSLTTPVMMGEGTPGEHPPPFHPSLNTVKRLCFFIYLFIF